MVELTVEQVLKLKEWADAQDEIVRKRQDKDRPYYGASGGALTYLVTPTSLGLVIQVRNNCTNDIIDLTEYADW